MVSKSKNWDDSGCLRRWSSETQARVFLNAVVSDAGRVAVSHVRIPTARGVPAASVPADCARVEGPGGMASGPFFVRCHERDRTPDLRSLWYNMYFYAYCLCRETSPHKGKSVVEERQCYSSTAFLLEAATRSGEAETQWGYPTVVVAYTVPSTFGCMSYVIYQLHKAAVGQGKV